MTAPYESFPLPTPVPDGIVANVVRWWQRLLEPINRALDYFDADVTPWRNVAVGEFANGWANYGALWGPARYIRRHGIVYLSGLIKDGAAGGATTVFTIAEGYRPAVRLIFSGWATNGYCRLDVDPSGVVILVNYDAGGTNSYVSLNNISYAVG